MEIACLDWGIMEGPAGYKNIYLRLARNQRKRLAYLLSLDESSKPWNEPPVITISISKVNEKEKEMSRALTVVF